MAVTYELQIVTPDGGFYDGTAEKLIARAIDGDLCILARHAQLVTALSTGEVRVTMEGGQVRRAACSGGMLTVIDGRVRLVANTFEWHEDIDAERAQRAKELAEQRIRDAKDEGELSLAKAKLSRALNRIHVAQ